MAQTDQPQPATGSAAAQRLQALLESAVDAIVTIDERGRIESVNPATERMFGYAADELLGENVKILMPSPDRESHDDYIARYLETGEKRIIGIGREVEGRRKDGSTFPVDLAVSEVAVDGTTIFMGTLRDLTERKLLERSLLQSQKMEAVGLLAGGVAHDFNTLLGTILGYVEMLEPALADQDESLRRYVERIHRAALRGADLTRQLLAFSRREDTRPRPLEVASVMNETVEMIGRLIGEDISFDHRLEEGLGVIAVDPGHLQQVLMNLTVNAADAMPHGGRLSISWGRAELDRDTPTEGGTLAAGVYAVLEVEDTGVGMPEENLERIFEPFFTTKPPGEGTGLGLSTVFGIVQHWRGGISVTSVPDRGSTFRVYIPEAAAIEPAEESDLATETETTEPCTATILLVEDDKLFRELIHEILEARGYRVLGAADPQAARALCAEAPEAPDVLVSDMVMPKGNGEELAAELRSRYPELRVILMSGYSDESRASRELDDSAADAFLEKPFPVDDLLRTIRSVMRTAEADA